MPDKVMKMLREQSEGFYAVGFEVKRWDKCINVFPRSEYHMFEVLYPIVAQLLTLPRTIAS
jgi:hypothetical protein